MSQEPQNPVLFVGAGPGAPELITLAGRDALAAADLVVHAGSLVAPEMLSWTSEGCRLVDSAPLDLEAIVAEMAAGQRRGERVVRLHSGDPSLYGAIREQIRALEAEGIPWRVIPGVTAAFAAAARLGMEYTLPEVTQSLILTRAAGRTPVPEGEDLASLAAHGASLAVYLSVGQAEAVSAALSGAYGPQAPVAVVYRATWPDERVLWTRAETLAQDLEAAGITRQALILAGPAVAAVSPAGDGGSTASLLYDAGFSHGWRRGREGGGEGGGEA